MWKKRIKVSNIFAVVSSSICYEREPKICAKAVVLSLCAMY